MKILMTLLIAVSMVGCGKVNTALSSVKGSTGDTGATGATGAQGPKGVAASILQNSTAAAYVLTVGVNYAGIYIPSAKVYTSLSMDSGGYSQSFTYFAGAGCTGSAATSVWVGETGHSVVMVNTSYYNVTASSTSFVYASYWSGTACVTSSGTTSATVPVGTLTATTRPFDFTSLAPLTLSFE